MEGLGGKNEWKLIGMCCILDIISANVREVGAVQIKYNTGSVGSIQE